MNFAYFIDWIRLPRKSAVGYIVLGCLLLTTIDLLQAEETKSDAEETLRRLIPHASAMDRATFEKMAKPNETPTKESFNDRSLTAELLVLDYDQVQKSKGDFRYLTKGPPPPNLLAKEMYRSIGVGKNRVPTAPVTLIHANRITKYEVTIEGTQATGDFEFRVPELCEGQAEFAAEKFDTGWQIVEFRMPGLGLAIRRDEAGSWRRAKDSKEQKLQTQDAPEAAFYSYYTPRALRICSSQEVLSLLDLNDQQKKQLNRLREEWRNEFQKFQSDPQAFFDKWRIGTGGPRGKLRKEFEAILTQEQKQVYDTIRLLWALSPVRSDSALREEYSTNLQLRLEQQKRLLALEGKWVRTAWRQIKELRSTAHGAIARLAWQFKAERDKVWREILTEKQANRWQQIELQQQLLGIRGPFIQGLIRIDYAARMKGELPQTGRWDDYFVPYFDSPIQVLNLDQQQQEEVNKICSEQIQAEKQDPIPKGQDYETGEAYVTARKAHLPKLAKMSREMLLRMENVLTDLQKQKWREMLGKPYRSSLEPYFP